MQVSHSYDAGARVLRQGDQHCSIISRFNYRWLAATDRKIYQTWLDIKKFQATNSDEYTLAKRQIQEVMDRHSSGLLG